MRLAIQGPLSDEVLASGRQVGATDYVSGAPAISRERGCYGFQELMIARNRVEDAGLKWTVCGMPEEWTQKIKLGLPGRDQQLFIDEGYVDMVRAMRSFRQIGFDGPMVEDHVPVMSVGPAQWPAKAFALGYMRAVMQAAGAD